MSTPQFSSFPEDIIYEELKRTEGYATIPYLAEKTGIAPEQVLTVAEAHPDKIRKSIIQTESGSPLFTANAPLSGIADYWQAFRALNNSKY